uniref:Uncharacterized protein n=1 Tax=Anguilla anguilla TaxID=7936 RepID=A0A0E9SPW8_ANGAN
MSCFTRNLNLVFRTALQHLLCVFYMDIISH